MGSRCIQGEDLATRVLLKEDVLFWLIVLEAYSSGLGDPVGVTLMRAKESGVCARKGLAGEPGNRAAGPTQL